VEIPEALAGPQTETSQDIEMIEQQP